MEAALGLTVMLVKVGPVTVRIALLVVAPEVALIVELPDAIPVTKPPAEAVAIEVLLLVQLTADVQLLLVLFAYAQLAVNC